MPYLNNYGILCWKSKINSVVKFQKKAVRIIMGAKYNAHTEPIFKYLSLLKVNDLCNLHELKFCYKLENKLVPAYFQDNIFVKNRNINTTPDLPMHPYSQLGMTSPNMASII